MKSKWIYTSFLLCALFSAMGQADEWVERGQELFREGQFQESLEPLKRAYQFYKESDNERGQVQSSLGLGYAYVNLHNIPESLTYYEMASDLSHENKWLEEEKEAADALSSMLYLTGQATEAIPYAQRCVEIGILVKDDEFHSTKLMELGYLYFKVGQIDSADTYLHRSLALKESINHRDGIVIVQNYLGEFYRSMGDFAKAQEYNFNNLNHWQETKDSVKLVTTYFNISTIFYEMGDIEKSKSYALESLELARILDLVLYKSFGIKRLAEINVSQNKVEEALKQYLEVIDIYEITEHKTRLVDVLLDVASLYLNKDEVDLAEQYLGKAESYEANTKDVKTRTKLQLFKCQFFMVVNELDQSISSAKEAFKIADEAALLVEKTEAALLISTSYSKSGNSEEALNWHRKYAELKEIVTQDNQQKSIYELETKYRVNQKQEEIKRLSTEQELNNLRLQEASRKQVLLVGGILLVSVIAGISYFFYRTKKRDNRLLEEKNQIIKVSLSEKELLVQEIHHRVKNNLQTISSLLNMQTYNLENTEALDAIRKGEARIKSMALIHDNLFKGKQGINLKASEYIEKLAKNLFATYKVSSESVSLEIEIEDISLDLDRMIALGLILNELISNALKYAFPGNREGKITVSLKQDANKVSLKVSDDGVGLADDYMDKNSLGFRIIRDFASKLKGELSVNTANGAHINLSIPTN